MVGSYAKNTRCTYFLIYDDRPLGETPFGWELGSRVFNPSPARPKDTRQSVKKGNKRVSQRVALILGRCRPPRRASQLHGRSVVVSKDSPVGEEGSEV